MEMAFEKNHAASSEVEETGFSHLQTGIEINDDQSAYEEVVQPLIDAEDEFQEKTIESTDINVDTSEDFSTQPEEESEPGTYVAEQKLTVPVELNPENILESPLEPAMEKVEVPEQLIEFPPEIAEPEIIDQEPAISENMEVNIEPEILNDLPAEIMEEQISKTTLPATEKEPEIMEIPLEPLYAVDYFASQGIRLREEDQQDQLGKKLKSFTEWLKSMKKVHPEKSKGQMDEKTEAIIKSEAELSNDKADVLTETMAEVFIKQGLTHKAIDVYEKLSLLDPLKSATFAAKISELKAQ
jgi:hypothetical protein